MRGCEQLIDVKTTHDWIEVEATRLPETAVALGSHIFQCARCIVDFHKVTVDLQRMDFVTLEVHAAHELKRARNQIEKFILG